MKAAVSLLLITTMALVALATGVAATLSRPLPPLTAGADPGAADRYARRLEQAIQKAAWDATGAVSFTFDGTHQHLWDRVRGFDRVRWDDVEVLVDLNRVDGRAWVGGVEAEGGRRERLVRDAYAAWTNDTFWLNPLAKLFDPGVERALVDWEGATALKITYTRGGLTPGDSYVWVAGTDGLPTHWGLWVSALPIRGLRASWEGWTPLSTGAKISTHHHFPGYNLDLQDVRGAADLATLEPGPDPFAPLLELR